MRYLLTLLILFSLFSCKEKQENPHILISTSFGDIEAELYPAKAPKTVAAFLGYIDSGFFKNSSFYRLQKTESAGGDIGMIQGGIWKTNNAGFARLPGIVHESTRLSGLSHTDGILSLARTTIGTGNTEFFICIGNQSQFDSGRAANADGMGYAAFGKVVSGMEIVKKIHEQPYDGKESFTNKVEIIQIRRQ
jgi:peptidyl-prolyl cis-trans isomerase A (cyclophilin A)